MRKIHLRGNGQEYVAQTTEEGVEISYGRSDSKRLRMRRIPISMCEEGDPERELRRRVDQKLAEGYQLVSEETQSGPGWLTLGYWEADGNVSESVLEESLSGLEVRLETEAGAGYVSFPEGADRELGVPVNNTDRKPRVSQTISSEEELALAYVLNARLTAPGFTCSIVDPKGNQMSMHDAINAYPGIRTVLEDFGAIFRQLRPEDVGGDAWFF